MSSGEEVSWVEKPKPRRSRQAVERVSDGTSVPTVLVRRVRVSSLWVTELSVRRRLPRLGPHGHGPDSQGLPDGRVSIGGHYSSHVTPQLSVRLDATVFMLRYPVKGSYRCKDLGLFVVLVYHRTNLSTVLNRKIMFDLTLTLF